ncbi:response regulator [Patescibacteria group bacterium]|nr:response regulator [Patescibacteria group bacterium]
MEAPGEEKKQPVEEPKPELDSKKKSIGRILMVEDDLPMAKMYSTKLQMEGFEVVVAHNGEEGLEKIEEGEYKLVLLDLMIPKLGGMEVLARLRGDKRFATVPVIILSNLSQEEDIKKAHELGVKDFLVKSNHTPNEIVGIVKSYF